MLSDASILLALSALPHLEPRTSITNSSILPPRFESLFVVVCFICFGLVEPVFLDREEPLQPDQNRRNKQKQTKTQTKSKQHKKNSLADCLHSSQLCSVHRAVVGEVKAQPGHV